MSKTIFNYPCFIGNQGPAGPQGPQGVQGAPNGPMGPQGYQGVQGSQGFQGVQGLSIIGSQGFQGSQGTQGSVGPQGSPNGPQGDQGPQGYQGFQGSQGLSIIGPQGVQGFQGVQGAVGPQGTPNGPQGDQGPQGVQGNQGPQGVQGFQGIQGIHGDQGIQGPQGHQGFQGIQGVQGSQGLQGIQGYQGNQGVSGSNNNIYNIDGSLSGNRIMNMGSNTLTLGNDNYSTCSLSFTPSFPSIAINATNLILPNQTDGLLQSDLGGTVSTINPKYATPKYLFYNTQANLTDSYITPFGGQTNVELNSAVIFPDNITVVGLNVNINTPPGPGNTRTFTVRKSASNTVLTGSISGPSQINFSASASISFTPSDYLTIISTTSGSPASCQCFASITYY